MQETLFVFQHGQEFIFITDIKKIFLNLDKVINNKENI